MNAVSIYIYIYACVSYRGYDTRHTKYALYMCRVACVRVLGILYKCGDDTCINTYVSYRAY